MELSVGESSRASQANRGLVMAIFMVGLLTKRGRIRRSFTTQHIPARFRGWSKNPKKNSAGVEMSRFYTIRGGTTFLDTIRAWKKT